MSLAQEAKPAKELLKEDEEVVEEAAVAVEAMVAEEDTEVVVVATEEVATEVAKEDMEVVVMEVAEEDMEEVAVDTEAVVAATEVEVAVVTIENHAMFSLWYCTQLPFYDIYYVSRFNTCENDNKITSNFNLAKTQKSKNKTILSLQLFYL